MLTREEFTAITERLGVHAETAKKWRQRGKVPHPRRLDFLEAAEALGVEASRQDLDRLRVRPPRKAA